MKAIALIGFLLTSFSLNALELDEKLTVRILETSKTRKTLLANRGLEDGLVVGDHAKFFLTKGVVARGVVIKASPSRSIWSVYRIIDSTALVNNKVMKIKISSPMKLTEDPSKALKADDMTGSIPLAQGANDVIRISPEEEEDLASLGGTKKAEDSAPMIDSSSNDLTLASGITNQTLELWGIANINSLSGTWEQGSDSNDASASSVDFTLGVEKYFKNSHFFLKKLSLVGLINKRTVNSDVKTGNSIDWFEYGVGANYHFLNHPLSYNRMIAYAGLTIGVGSASSETTVDSTTTTAETLEGSSSFFSIGGGAKYYLKKGWGFRASIDYLRSTTEFSFDGSEDLTVSLSGLRMRAGLSYRW